MGCWSEAIAGKSPGPNIGASNSNSWKTLGLTQCRIWCNADSRCKAIIFRRGAQCTKLSRFYDGNYANSATQFVSNYVAGVDCLPPPPSPPSCTFLPPSPPAPLLPPPSPPVQMSQCGCGGATLPADGPTSTCRAVGDPHYLNFNSRRFDFYARGLYEHARFTIASCGCEVVVQVLLAKLISGRNRANSGIAATSLRAGDTTFSISGGGLVRVTSGHAATLSTLAELQPTSAPSTTVFGETAIVRQRVGRAWAWRIVLPAFAGSYLVIPAPTAVMPDGFIYQTWLTVNQQASPHAR